MIGTHVGVSGFGGVAKHRTKREKEAEKRNHVVFVHYGFAKASIGRTVETRLNQLWASARRATNTPHRGSHSTRGWDAKSLSAPCR